MIVEIVYDSRPDVYPAIEIMCIDKESDTLMLSESGGAKYELAWSKIESLSVEDDSAIYDDDDYDDDESEEASVVV